jgi:tripartite-type tricarboxylate transporter receptor subunit TctC
MKVCPLLVAIIVCVASPVSLSAQELFYKGKVLRIIVGTSAGSALDVNSRALARHMGKHIPGDPTIVVENMTGAGSLVAARHLYKVAKPDGLTVGNFIADVALFQLMGRSDIDIDFLKFGYVGVPNRDTIVCALTKASGITSIEKWTTSKVPVKLGSTAPGASIDNIPRVLKAVLRLPIQVVSGYKGTAEIRLAAGGGEIAGGCWTWGSIRATWTKALQAGEVIVVLQNRAQPHPELPTVPLTVDLAKTEQERELLLRSDLSSITFTFAVAPGTPDDRLQTLRKAFMDTWKDREFLADAAKSQIPINPVTGQEVEETVGRILRMDPALKTKLKEILTAN